MQKLFKYVNLIKLQLSLGQLTQVCILIYNEVYCSQLLHNSLYPCE